jgi:hypothetical protein
MQLPFLMFVGLRMRNKQINELKKKQASTNNAIPALIEFLDHSVAEVYPTKVDV